MNILLVDDDAYVLEALQKSLDWDTMGIENVYTAQSVNRARKIIEDIPIQILVCDIEMPKENGFELLKWLKEKEYIITEILLTSYAEFKYATEAIKYGCYAYALKPIDYEELEKMITGAIEEEKRALSLINHDKYYEYWTASQKIRKEQYFWDYVMEHQSRNNGKYDFHYTDQQQFLPVMLRYETGMHGSYSYFGRGMFEWTLNNLISEVLTTEDSQVEAVLQLQKDEFLAILLQNQRGSKENVNIASGMLMKRLSKNLDINCSIVVGCMTDFQTLPDAVREFMEDRKLRLVEFGEIKLLNNYQPQPYSYKSPEYPLWESFLRNGQFEAVQQEVEKYIDRLQGSNQLDREVLRRLYMDFTQLMISVLKESGIHTYQMGNSLFHADFIDYSVQTVTRARNGIRQMLDTVWHLMKSREGDTSIVRTVRDYIEHNLDKEMTREDLAQMVHLNQDYLARIFKKETGDSLMNYITGKRVEAAKHYLLKTGESVNTIAMRVGYDNFSYFTKIFKDRTGMTPKDYRRSCQKEE